MNALMPNPVISSLRREMDRLFDRVWEGNLETPLLGAWTPAVNVSESTDVVKVKLEIPGIEPKDVHVTLKDQVLVIRGEKVQETKGTDEKFYRTERSYGAFARAIQLPAAVDKNKVNASFKNGVLIVTMEKVPEAKGTAIPVTGG